MKKVGNHHWMLRNVKHWKCKAKSNPSKVFLRYSLLRVFAATSEELCCQEADLLPCLKFVVNDTHFKNSVIPKRVLYFCLCKWIWSLWLFLVFTYSIFLHREENWLSYDTHQSELQKTHTRSYLAIRGEICQMVWPVR